MVLGFIIRAGVVVGAVYYSRKLGVWGDTQETEHLYNELKNELRPHFARVEKELPFQLPKLPQTGEMRFLAKHYYNQGVKETFDFIRQLPSYVDQAANGAKSKFEDFAQAPPTGTVEKAK